MSHYQIFLFKLWTSDVWTCWLKYEVMNLWSVCVCDAGIHFCLGVATQQLYSFLPQCELWPLVIFLFSETDSRYGNPQSPRCLKCSLAIYIFWPKLTNLNLSSPPTEQLWCISFYLSALTLNLIWNKSSILRWNMIQRWTEKTQVFIFNLATS